MSNIQEGTTRDLGTVFWDIKNNSGTRVASFNHNQFPNLLNNVRVYFIDLDLNGLCENVQVATDVDNMVLRATPGAGIKNDAEEKLRTYIMLAFLNALSINNQHDRTTYLNNLQKKMDTIKQSAIAISSPVTLAILAANGVI